MTELRDPYLRRPIPAATRPRRVALARPISRAGVRPRPPRERDWKGRDRARQLGCLPVVIRRARAGEKEGRRRGKKKTKVASKQGGARQRTAGHRGKRVMIIDCGQFPSVEPPPSPMLPSNSKTLSSSRAAAHITSRHLLVYLSLASRLSGLCFLRKFGFFLADCLSLQCRPSTLVLVPHDPIARLRPPCRHSCCWGQPLGRSTPTVDPFYLDPTGVPTRKKLLAVPIPRSLQAPSSKLDASGHIKSVVVSTRRRCCCCCKIAVVLLDLHSKVKA